VTPADAKTAVTLILAADFAAVGWAMFACLAGARLPSLRCELGRHAWTTFVVIQLFPSYHQIPMRRCTRCGRESMHVWGKI